MAKKRRTPSTADALLKRILKSGSYRGKHVILVGGKVYAAVSGADLKRLFDQATKEFPEQKPTLAYIPQADTLILLLRRP